MNTNIKFELTVEILKKRYSFDETKLEVTKINHGIENENYKVVLKNQKYVLRVYNQQHSIRGLRNIKSIEKELLFIKKALDSGLKVPSIKKTVKGEDIVTIKVDSNDTYLVLFDFLDGKSPESYNEKIAERVGEVVSHLFDVEKLFKFDEINFFNNNIAQRAFRMYVELEKSAQLVQFKYKSNFEELNKNLKVEYQSVEEMNLTKGIVHGDIKLENILFIGEDVSGLLDFDDYRFSYLLEETAMAIMHDLDSTNKNIIRSGNYENFISGISNKQLLDELKYLHFFLRIRFLYDISKYLLNENQSLANQLWEDPQVVKFIS